MPSNPDFSINHPGLICRALAPLTALLAISLLAGCGHLLNDPEAVAAAKPAPAPVAVVARPQPRPLEPVPPSPRISEGTGEPTLRMLAYAERIRTMPAAELNQEIARLGDVKTPVEQLQLSLALSQLRQVPETSKAQELLARVLGSPDTEGLHLLARLLASRYLEQRRLEDQFEKQNQQTRDIQRRLDQTNERLEALKAIERSLVSRQPPASSAVPAGPASRPRPPP